MSMSKQRKTTESTVNMPVLAAPPAATFASVYASESASASGLKQEGMGSEVVSSDIDLAGFSDDPSAFLDILKTIGGCEFPLEFQKCFSESERDSNNLSVGSGELTWLSVSDVNDAVAEKLPATQQSSVDHEPPMQSASFPFQSFDPLHGNTKYVDAPSSASAVPVDNYCVCLLYTSPSPRDS